MAFVAQTCASGCVGDLNYDQNKNGDPGSVDRWVTNMGQYKYDVGLFRFTGGVTVTEQGDGSTLVQYRGAYIEVFKRNGGEIASREQCMDSTFVDYDVTAR